MLNRNVLPCPIAIGTLADYMIEPDRCFWIGVKGFVIGAKVTGEEQAASAHLKLDRRGT